MAAKARRFFSCTAIRSAIYPGTNSHRGWPNSLRWWRPICAVTEKPPGGADHANYSFRAMAADQIEVMAALGHERFYAAGHDRGARVLHRMCLDHPHEVARAAILDIIPQHHLLNNVTRAPGGLSRGTCSS